MNNFNDRIYLVLTLKRKELVEYYLQTIGVIIAVAIYNLIGVFTFTPIVISYYSLILAFTLISLLFIYLNSQALPIDWELLERVEEELKEESGKPQSIENLGVNEEPVEEIPEEVEVAPSNEEIQMVELTENEFDFGDMLTSLYNAGTTEQLSNAAVNGIEQKVRRINIR